MFHKQFYSVSLSAILVFGMMPAFGSQTTGMQMPASGQTAPGQKSPDTEMTDHQKEMQTLLANLQKSFQAVVDAKDASGYVKDKSIVKAHEGDITALRNAVKEHKLFLTAEEQKCGVGSKQGDVMIQHQQLMKSVLYDVVETFSTYQSANDSSPEASEPVEDALAAHRAALKELADASTQHQQAMLQMMKKCS